MNDKTLSHQLSYLLRHAPHEAGLTLLPGGWTPLEPLLAHLKASREQVEAVVQASDKQRFALRGTATGPQIRANQGHSVPVDLELEAAQPPTVLFHGTVGAALDSICAEGLTKRNRHHVHLSPDQHTARKVGERRGPPVILTVQAGKMAAAGYAFYRSENGVWLVDAVPVEFITFP
ncbi:RNA 2'-phosphotransferase [Deinococcus sp.]|uniref:RNA 2'-phosphotransferase n=1 Tax=Deinococcus sp. TaxID=47478 RepID=UPI0025FC7E12|nr:RNA 2'-phosphotransferase [Deinococcus sp.]